MALNKPIDIELLNEAIKFFDDLPIKVQKKLFVCFDKTKLGIKGNWFKSIGNDIWEFKTTDGIRFYRLLAFWDKTGNTETLIVATHGFNKKTNNTPKQQKQKAIKLRKQYFESKSKNT